MKLDLKKINPLTLQDAETIDHTFYDTANSIMSSIIKELTTPSKYKYTYTLSFYNELWLNKNGEVIPSFNVITQDQFDDILSNADLSYERASQTYYSVLFSYYILCNNYQKAYELINKVFRNNKDILFTGIFGYFKQFDNYHLGTVAKCIVLNAVANNKLDTGKYKSLLSNYVEVVSDMSIFVEDTKNEIMVDPILRKYHNNIMRYFKREIVSNEFISVFREVNSDDAYNIDILKTNSNILQYCLNIIISYNLDDNFYTCRIDSIHDYRIRAFTDNFNKKNKDEVVKLMREYIYKQYMYGKPAKKLIKEIRAIQELMTIANYNVNAENLTDKLPMRLQLEILAYLCK